MSRSDLRYFLALSGTLGLAACGGSDVAERRGDAPSARPAASQAAPPAAPGGEVALESAPGAAQPSSASAVAGASPSAGGAPARPIGTGAASGAPAPRQATAQQAATAPPRRESEPGAHQVLERVERAYTGVKSFQADFVQDLHVPLLGTRQRSTGKIYQRRPDRFLMKFADPAGDVIVADGRHFWMYYPSSDRTQVMRTSIAEGSEHVDLHQQFLSNPTERFVATMAGTETVDGRAAHVLTLVPRQPSSYRQLRIWVDQADYSVRRFEMTEENESVRRLEFRNLRKNVALPDGLFAFTPPKGTQVFDQ